MSHQVYCLKLKKESLGLDRPPIPGELGERIFENISKEAWQLWMKEQTILINERHLKMSELKSRQFIMAAMEKFLFENGEPN